MKPQTNRFSDQFRRVSQKIVAPTALLLFCFCVVSCQKPFNVNVKAAEPIKVDLTMDVHVYNHGGTTTKKANLTSASGADSKAEKYKTVLDNRRNRMAEVQTMKNARYVGENHLGLLELRSLPDGNAADWVRKTLEDENEDRKYLMTHEAETKEKDLKEVQTEQRLHLQRKSHVGEWIEIDHPENPGSYLWIEKESPGDS